MQAAISAGYSKSTASLGPSALRVQIKGLDKAFRSLERRILSRKPDELKQAAIDRIVKTCEDDDNRDNLKAAELIGRFKSVDLFVRNTETQIGIFAALGETIAAESNALAEYESPTIEVTGKPAE